MKKCLAICIVSIVALPVILALAATPVPSSGSANGLAGRSGSGSSSSIGIDAVTAARYDLRLGFNVPGRVAKVNVKPGDKVEAGKVLVELEDSEGEAMVGLYLLRSESKLKEQSAHEQLQQAILEEETLTKVGEAAAAKIELSRATTKRKLAELDEQSAGQEHKELEWQYRQTKSRHEQYQLTAPVAGVIDIAQISPGDSVEAGKPAIRLVVTDPLWIDVPVPTAGTLTLKVGDTALVHSKLPGFEEAMTAHILHVAAVADAGSNTRMVRVELPNPRSMPAGTQVSVEFPGVVQK